MSAGEESLEYQGVPEWDHPRESFVVRSGQMTEAEVWSLYPEMETS